MRRCEKAPTEFVRCLKEASRVAQWQSSCFVNRRPWVRIPSAGSKPTSNAPCRSRRGATGSHAWLWSLRFWFESRSRSHHLHSRAPRASTDGRGFFVFWAAKVNRVALKSPDRTIPDHQTSRSAKSGIATYSPEPSKYGG